MPIIAACTCGKKFKAKDHLAGKSMACPSCGKSMRIPVPAVPVEAVASPAAPVAKPVPAAAPKSAIPSAFAGFPGQRRPAQQTPEKESSFAISPKMILFFSLLVGVPLIILLIKLGPVKAMSTWKETVGPAEINVQDAIDQFIFIEAGSPSDPRFRPKVNSFFFDEPVMMWSMPSKMNFQGRSTFGVFKGFYEPASKKISAEVEVMGTTKPLKAHVEGEAKVVLD